MRYEFSVLFAPYIKVVLLRIVSGFMLEKGIFSSIISLYFNSD